MYSYIICKFNRIVLRNNMVEPICLNWNFSTTMFIRILLFKVSSKFHLIFKMYKMYCNVLLQLLIFM